MKKMLTNLSMFSLLFLGLWQQGISQCTVDAGTISTTDPTTICVDGISDPINVTVTGDTGAESAWIITDLNNNILATPPGGPFDLDGAGPGVCLIWYISHDGTLAGNMAGNNTSDLSGCFALSNEIAVTRNEPIGGMLAGGPYEFCVDGAADNIPVGDVTVSGNDGETSQWVITDDQFNILGLPPSPDVVDFDVAGAGTCYIHNVSLTGTVTGLTMGNNLNTDVMGCFSVSDNFVTVVRNEPLGGMLVGGPYEFCVDGDADNIPAGEVTVIGNTGAINQWVVTDDQRNILGLPPSPEAVNFDGAGPGMCYIFNVSYYGTLTGLVMGSNLNDVEGCFSESDNFITVVRNQPDGGSLMTEDSTTICIDGIGDPIDVEVIDALGDNMQWIITDDTLKILAKPAGPPFDLDGAGPGTCLIWHLSSFGTIIGDTINGELEKVVGCYDLSDSIAVVRNEAIGGTLTGGPYEFCVSDGIADNIPTGGVTISGNQGATSQWIVTDDQRNILGLPPTPSAVNFEGVFGGTCRIYNVSYFGALIGLGVGQNLDDIEGCFSESDNFIAVVRNEAIGGTLTGGPYEFCVSDGIADNIPTGGVTISGNQGAISQWVVTDDQRNILGLPPTPSAVNFEGVFGGTCRIYNVSYFGTLIGLGVGQNLDDIEGCFSESDNFIAVVRNEAIGGTLTGGPYEFCVSDGIADNIPAGGVTISGNQGATSQWVVTDDQRNILGLPPTPSAVNFEGVFGGTCRIYNVSYFGTLIGLGVGQNLDDIEGCFSESDNFIAVIRNEAIGGTISTNDATTICVDGNADPINVTLTGEAGENSAWIITDADLNILALPAAPPFNLDPAGPGVCLIWHLSFVDGLTGAEVGQNAADIDGCFELSNSISVTRDAVDGGTVAFANGDDIYANCPGQVIFDVEHETSNEYFSYYYIITSEEDNILGFVDASTTSTLDLSIAPLGECHIWGWNSIGTSTPVVGQNITSLQGQDCEELSDNFLIVLRQTPDGGEISLAGGGTEYEGCAGELEFDLTYETSTFLDYWFVVTDDNSNILTYFNSSNGGWIDIDDAPPGVCRIYGWNEKDQPSPVAGSPISSLNSSCGEVSENWVTITRLDCDINCSAEPAAISTTDDTSICVDGNPDPINVTVEGGEGMNSAWVITDEDGNILGLPSAGPFDLDGAGEGTCLIWYLTFDNIEGAELGLNTNDIEGCFEFSNPIIVTREAANGGMVSLTDGSDAADFCAGDVIFDVQHTTTAPNLSYWYIITDDNDNILAFHDSADGSTIDASGAPAGVCHIWGWSYSGESDPVIGDNISSLSDGDCEAISNNFITINRIAPEAAIISTADDTSICVDGNPDPINVTVEGGTGSNTAWVITDTEGEILALPAMGPFDLDGAGEGTCLIWYLTYQDVAGAELGLNANDLTGCFALSNPITVYREVANGGIVALTDGSTEGTFTAGDVIFDVQHTTTAPNLSYWYIITDDNDNILAFHNSADGPTIDASGAPAGVCHVWGWSYSGESDPIIGENISSLSDGDCEAISDNFITIIREESGAVLAATISTMDDTTICVDGSADPIHVDVTGGTGANSAYVITDIDGIILGLPPMGPFDLDGAGEGVCLIWHLSYDTVGGVELGLNANDLTGEFALSNPITVTRQAANGGLVALTNGQDTATYCAGSVVFDVAFETTATALSYWFIITDDNDNILEVHNSADGATLDLSAAPAGVCHVWGWSYKGEPDPIIGENISTLADGACESISTNFITITRSEGVSGGTISTDDSVITCPGDGEDDIVSFTTTGTGDSYAYVLTDEDDVIMSMAMTTASFNFEDSEPGIARIYGVGYVGSLILGNTIQEVGGDGGGCAGVSDNFIEVVIQETADCFTSSTDDAIIGNVKVYPNPAVNFITVEYADLSSDATVSILDARGGKVISRSLSDTDDQIRLNVANMLAGLYLVRITSNEAVITKRIVLAK